MTVGPHADDAHAPMSVTERALAEKADRYRSLFAYIPNGVFSLDLEGRLTDANDAFEHLVGRSLEDLVGADNRLDLIHPDDMGAAAEAFAAVKQRVPQTLEVRLLTARGDVREIKLSAVPVVVFDQVVGVHGMTEDVTEANGMHRDLEAANAAKTLFLANVSREVRTPLTMILGATEMLLDTDLDAAQSRLGGMVDRHGRRLMRLVHDILDFSRLEARKVSLHPAPFRLADVLEELLEWAQPRAAAQGVQLAATMDASLPPVVDGDVVRVSQVLSNLVDNALKFTAAGTVDVAIGLLPATADADADVVCVELAVTDSGIGVAPEHLELLFDSFTQADPSATRTHSGVGLGLAICRDLVALMGGDLGAVSTPGGGSTFTATLPLRRVGSLSGDGPTT